jgi:hypothetical protein
MISAGGGNWPVWSSGGRELFFLGSDGRMIAVDYSTNGGTFVPGKPRVWSPVTLPAGQRRIANPNYDVAPDGKRFAVVVPVDAPQERSTLTLLFHFFDELNRRVPVK